MWFLIVLLILLFIAVLPVGLIADYDAHGARVLLTIGPVRISLYPRDTTAKKCRNKPDKAGPAREKQGRGSGGKLSEF